MCKPPVSTGGINTLCESDGRFTKRTRCPWIFFLVGWAFLSTLAFACLLGYLHSFVSVLVVLSSQENAFFKACWTYQPFGCSSPLDCFCCFVQLHFARHICWSNLLRRLPLLHRPGPDSWLCAVCRQAHSHQQRYPWLWCRKHSQVGCG